MGKYMIFTYQSLCILTSNDWMPNTLGTNAFAAFMILFGIIVTANLFGELAVLLYELNKNDIKYQKSVDTANTAMQKNKTPVEIQNTALAYMQSTRRSKEI
jgi:flagellar motor component MotA